MRKCSKNNGKVQGARTDTLITNKKKRKSSELRLNSSNYRRE